MEAFTEILLSELRRRQPAPLAEWRHVDTTISKAIHDRTRVRLGKLGTLARQWSRSVSLAAAGFDAYYPISQNKTGLLRDVALLLPFRLARRRVVVHLHGGMLDRVLERESRLLRAAVRWVTATERTAGIALTPSLRRCLQPLLPPERIHVVPNTSDVPDWAAEKDVRPPLRVLYLSNLIKTKGYPELVSAVIALADAGVPIELALAGEPRRPDDARWLDEFGSHPAVHRLGQITGDEKWEALRRSHVVALPTTFPPEGQPMSLIEGMGAGCAIVACRHAGIGDTVSEEEGILLPAARGRELERQLTEALRVLAEDPERAARLGRAARARYERELAPDRFIARWLSVVGGDDAETASARPGADRIARG